MVNAASVSPRRIRWRWLRSVPRRLLLPAALLLPGLALAQSSTDSQPPTTTTAPQDTSQTPTDPGAMTPGNTAPGTSPAPGATPDTGGSGAFEPDAGTPTPILERPGEEDAEDDALPGTGGSGSDPERQLGEPAGQPIPGMERTVPPQVEVPPPPTPQSGSPSQGP